MSRCDIDVFSSFILEFHMNHGVKHLAIIMDGNRRWAKENGLPSLEGHRRGYDKLKEVGDWCLEKKINVLSVFAFSTENWKRTTEEVGFLMDLLEMALSKELDWFKSREVRLRILGRREGLRPSILRAVDQAEAETKENKRATFCICLNYGGRTEIVDAFKKMAHENIAPEKIDESVIQSHLYAPDLPDPDLIIRTSGEERLSGFLLWQAAYTELYWCKTHWPAFSKQDLEAALETYEARERRYGK
ncbi:MAG TPA: polyprenyl diphosphate synthase [Patescibacteria group bacterium]|nr:polyprenyl diphosphate synthase [Patescibacteria group bacterium]